MQISEDGGKTFRRMKEKYKHSDNHALAFRADDQDYLLVGTDGGLYESFDLAANWRFISNLPVTQFYKVALDDSKPFYNIYGGTQDNNTQGGPSRTDNPHGIRNADWFITLFGDGHQPATEPGNPDILYSEWQQGNLVRVDRTTGELVYIQPQPEVGENYERYNWDAPILVSPHSPTRLYFASQRVWRSENRGDSWTAISGDLTPNQERFALPIMGQIWSWDSPWDVRAMSSYNTITSLAESPLQENLIYAGTDDGFIQITDDGGANWRSVAVGELPGVPATAFVNDIKADLHDVNTAYVVLDNHKYGDFNPYLFKSKDGGKTWRSIKGNLPERTLTWRVVQDHIKPNLLFVATEFGIYFTVDGGSRWSKLSGGVPTISFRDLAIQRRENDLVGASFGRGFFVFDDFSVLREVSEAQLKREATLFPTRKAWWYIQRPVVSFDSKGSQGAAYYAAPNPPFGAVFTYYLADDLKSRKAARQADEKSLAKKKMKVAFPGWKELDAERGQTEPEIWLTIRDSDGQVVRRVKGKPKKGFHRIAWDLRYPATQAFRTDHSSAGDEPPRGMLAAPGEYTVTLSKQVDGISSDLSEAMQFVVEQMRKGALAGAEPKEVALFWRELAKLQRATTAATQALRDALKRTDGLRAALARTPAAPGELDKKLHEVRTAVQALDAQLNGSRSKAQVGEKTNPTINSRIDVAMVGTSRSTYGPTPMQRRSFEIASTEFRTLRSELSNILDEQLPNLEKAMQEAGAPWMQGQPLPRY